MTQQTCTYNVNIIDCAHQSQAYDVRLTSACQRNAIQMAFRWWVDGGRFLMITRKEVTHIHVYVHISSNAFFWACAAPFDNRDDLCDPKKQILAQLFVPLSWLLMSKL